MTSPQTNPLLGPIPLRPTIATLAVTLHADSVLLVRRNDPAEAAQWGLPGGEVEWGETVLEAAQREMSIETGLSTLPLRAFSAHDIIETDDNGVPNCHIVFIAVMCAYIAGTPRAGDDTREARWFALGDLANLKLKLSVDVFEIVRRAAALHRESGNKPSDCISA